MNFRFLAQFQLIALISFALFIGCSLKRSEPAGNTEILAHYQPPAESANYSGSNFYSATDTPILFSGKFILGVTPTPPNLISEFNCLVFNVVGSGVPPSQPVGGENPYAVSALTSMLLSGQPCTYPGVMSAPFSPSTPTTRSLSVPSGANRIVQVLGIKTNSSSYCSTGQFSNNSNSEEPYEIARAVVSIFQDTSVSLSSNYNSLSQSQKLGRYAACEAPNPYANFDPNSISGLRVWYQAGKYYLNGSLIDPVPTGPMPTPTGTAIQFQNMATAAPTGTVANPEYVRYNSVDAHFAQSGNMRYFDIPSIPAGFSNPGTAFTRSLNPDADFTSVFGLSPSGSMSQMTLVVVGLFPTPTPNEKIGIFGINNDNDFIPGAGKTVIQFYRDDTSGSKYVWKVGTGAAPVDLELTVGSETQSARHIHIVTIDGSNNVSKYAFFGKNNSFYQTSSTAAGFALNFNNGVNINIGLQTVAGPNFYNFKGQLSDVLIFNRILTESEINNLVGHLKYINSIN